MSEPSEETVLYVEHRYVCSECSHLSASLEDALLHQQHHLGPQQQQHHVELVGLAGDYQALAMPESSQYQCLECGQLLVSPGQLLEHQEMHIKMLGQDSEPPPAVKPSAGQIHYECVECKALFTSQEVWLAHRQSHRAEPPASQGQNQALVDLEHSYRKPEEEEEEEAGTESGGTVQLLLYECGECLQLFQNPKDFLEHQAAHLAAPALNGGANETPAAADHSYELKDSPEEAVPVTPVTPARRPAEHRCAECEQLFPTAHQLQLHLRCHRLGAFQCPLCSKVLPSPPALEQHLGGHSGESHFLCLDCGLAFDTEAVLLAHRRTHSPNPLHRCPCGKAFVNMTKFLYHRRTHGTPPAARTHPETPPAPENVAPPPPQPESAVPLAVIYSSEVGETPGPSYRCLMCSKVFSKHPQLARHQRFVHRLERRHKCPTCGKMFKKKSHVRNHLLTHTGERPFHCKECGKSFNSQANLLRHRLTHTGERPYECEVCHKRFTQSSTLRQHLFVHSRRYPYKCQECGVRFHRPYRLLMHRYHHTGEYPYKCQQCGRSFLLRRLLEVHQLSHAGRQPQICAGCGAAFVTSLQLREHKCGKISRRFECPTCGKKVGSAARLRAHERVHGVPGEPPPPPPPPLPPISPPTAAAPPPRRPPCPKSFECGDCKKLFSTETSLQVHRRIHTGERPYPCPDCGKAFRQSTHLKDHRRLHTGEKPFKCEECGKAFAIAVRLAEHRRIHTGERPYRCEACGKAYRSFSNLWKHRKLHQQQRLQHEREVMAEAQAAAGTVVTGTGAVTGTANDRQDYGTALAIMETIEIYPAPPDNETPLGNEEGALDDVTGGGGLNWGRGEIGVTPPPPPLWGHPWPPSPALGGGHPHFGDIGDWGTPCDPPQGTLVAPQPCPGGGSPPFWGYRGLGNTL